MPRFCLNLKIRIFILMAKFESVTLVRRDLQKENFKDIPVNKTINNIHEKFCQTGSVEELPHTGRTKNLMKIMLWK